MTELSNQKNLEAMKNFAEQYAKRTDTYFCADPSVTAVVIQGLARHKEELGSPLCPCRHYEDKEAEVKKPIGIVLAYPCEREKNVIVCYLSLLIMNLQENNKKLLGKI